MKTRSSVSGLVIMWIILALVLAGIVFYFSASRSFVPDNFKDARSQSSVLASDLVVILDASVKNLDKISEEDKAGRFSSALNLVEEETKNIENAKNKALELSDKLGKMAQAVQGIKPATAKSLAFDAVSQEVSLINHLLNYNAYFEGLLKVLKMKFEGDKNYDGDNVQIFINNMNREGDDINSLNDSFNQKLREFDSAIN